MKWSLQASSWRIYSFLEVAAVLLSFPFESLAASGSQDLGSVLDGISDLSTYKNLLTQYPDILLQLPNYAGITIVAPNNNAFAHYQGFDPTNKTQVTALLEYHILQGTVATAAIPEGPPTIGSTFLTDPAYSNVTGGAKVLIDKQPGDVVVFTSGAGSRATLVDGDITFDGGLIQVIDTLMVPPERMEPTMRVAYPDLTAFLAALYAADQVPFFADSANVTIFAPYNAAFQQVAGTLTNLSQAALARVLDYHIVPNQVLFSTDLTNGTNLATAATTPGTSQAVLAHVLRAGNNAYVDRAQIIQPDILIANGVMHMVDGVLNPDDPAARPNPTAAGAQAPVFPLSGATSTGASVATPFVTALPCTADCPVSTSAAVGGGRNGTEAASAAGSSATGAASGTGAVGATSSSEGGAARQTGLVAVAGLVGIGLGVGMLGAA